MTIPTGNPSVLFRIAVETAFSVTAGWRWTFDCKTHPPFIKEMQMSALIEESLLGAVKVGDPISMVAASRRAIITFAGRLDARARDSRLVLRLNNARTGYQSFVVADGHYGAGEWDNSGLYIGRNGWALDCDVSFRYIIDVTVGRKRSGFGMATFAHADDRIIGYSGHGFWNNTHAGISNIELYAVGGGQSVGDLTVAWE